MGLESPLDFNREQEGGAVGTRGYCERERIITYYGLVKIYDDVGLVGLSLELIESDTEPPASISLKKNLVVVRYVFIFLPKNNYVNPKYID